jgi:hypothetical protein
LIKKYFGGPNEQVRFYFIYIINFIPSPLKKNYKNIIPRDGVDDIGVCRMQVRSGDICE